MFCLRRGEAKKHCKLSKVDLQMLDEFAEADKDRSGNFFDFLLIFILLFRQVNVCRNQKIVERTWHSIARQRHQTKIQSNSCHFASFFLKKKNKTLQRVDRDGNGVLDFDEFCAFIVDLRRRQDVLFDRLC